MNDANTSLLRRLAAFDRQRAGVPGEHAMAFALGAYLLLRGRQSGAVRLASVAAGALLIARALSGRDGAIAALRRRAAERGETRFTEVAAPWPYERRVRLSTPHRTGRGSRATSDAS